MNTEAVVSVNLNKQNLNKVKKTPDSVIKQVARLTLDLSHNIIPLSHNVNSGNLRRSSSAYGVQGGNGDYTIGSTTSYAKRVWNMNPNTTNWTTSGTTSKWFLNTFKTKGKSIVANAVNTNLLK